MVQLPVESHIPEQQASPVVHGVPNTPHGLLASGESPCLPPQAATSNAKHNTNQPLWIIGISSPSRSHSAPSRSRWRIPETHDYLSGHVALKGRKVSRSPCSEIDRGKNRLLVLQ